MTQSKHGGKTPTGQSNKGALPPQVVLIELKDRILAALNKLSDRDTQQIALEDLENVAQSLSPDGIALFLSCVSDTDLQQKAVVRRECVKLFGTLATLHGECLVPHLPRIVSNVVRRLKDHDSAIREACVDVMGVLAVQVPYPVAASGGDTAGQTPPSVSVGVYMKPLLEALTEQNKGVQLGASLCLARVLDKVENIPVATVQRLVPRIVKFMSMPGFLAKSGLLSVIGSLAHAVGGSGSAGASLLTSLVPCAQECLESSDWGTRKAAGDTLLRMAMSLGPALSPFKATVMPALDACRFDKVKPVRDSVNDAIALWKNVPGGDFEESSPAGRNGGRARSVGDSNSVTSSLSSSLRGSESDAPNSLRTSRPLFSPTEVQQNPGLSSPSREQLSGRKKSPTLGDRKLNPEFFRKLDNLRTDELQVEVRGEPPVSPSGPSKEEMDNHTEIPLARLQVSGCHVTANSQSYSLVEIKQDADQRKSLGSQVANSVRDLDTPNVYGQCNKNGEPHFSPQHNSNDRLIGNHRWSMSPSEPNVCSPATSDFDTKVANEPSTSDFDMKVANDPSMWTAIRRHLQQIERQQAQLMDLFQDFVTNSQEGMSGLEATVHNLERAVEKVGHDVAASAGRVGPDVMMSRMDLDITSLARMQNGIGGALRPDYTGGGIEDVPLPPKLAGLRSGETYPKWMVDKGSLILDEFSYGFPLLAGTESLLTASHQQRPLGYMDETPPLAGTEGLMASHQQLPLGYMDEFEGEINLPSCDSNHLTTRRGWENNRESRTPSRPEGGARGVWQSANAQARATLAAIRGAGFQGGDAEGIDTDLSKLGEK